MRVKNNKHTNISCSELLADKQHNNQGMQKNKEYIE